MDEKKEWTVPELKKILVEDLTGYGRRLDDDDHDPS